MIALRARGLVGRKLRTVLTALAIVLGVAMVSGTFVLTDSIASFQRDLHLDVYRDTDASSRASPPSTSATTAPATPPFDESLLQKVRHVPGRRGGARRRRGGCTADRQERQGDHVRRRAQHRLQRRSDAAPVQLARRSSKGAGRRRARCRRQVDGREEASRSRPDDRRAVARAGRESAHLRNRQVRRRFRRSAEPRSPASPADCTAALRQGGQARPDPRRGEVGVSPEKLVAEVRSILPPGTQVRTGTAQATKDASDTNELHLVPAEVPARLWRHRALRRLVRDRQLALDHDRPANAGVRDAAHAWVLRVVRCSGRCSSSRSRSACSRRSTGLFFGLALAKGLFRLFDPSASPCRTTACCSRRGRSSCRCSWVSLVTVLASLRPAFRATRVSPDRGGAGRLVLPPGRFARFRPVGSALYRGLGFACRSCRLFWLRSGRRTCPPACSSVRC